MLHGSTFTAFLLMDGSTAFGWGRRGSKVFRGVDCLDQGLVGRLELGEQRCEPLCVRPSLSGATGHISMLGLGLGLARNKGRLC